MRINSLTVRNFRNLNDIHFTPGPHLKQFLGGNAQGKTSLLESIYFTTTLKSFRTTFIDDLIKFSKTESQIECGFENQDGRQDELIIRFGHQDRKLIFNGKNVSKMKIWGVLQSVVFSPESLQAIKEGPSSRRKLVDDAASLIFKEAYPVQSQYEKIVKQKNSCLRQMKTGELTLKAGRDMVDSLTELQISAASEVLFLRLQLIKKLIDPMHNVLEKILNERVKLRIENISDGKIWETASLTSIAERVEKEIKNPSNRVTEEALGRSIEGPHRHEIIIHLNNEDARYFSSQGQQRALILAFKISQIVYHKHALGTYPILLLDDVLSEFDAEKRKFLIEFLCEHEAQTFLTTTEYEHLLNGASVFHLDRGALTKQAEREGHGSEHRN